MCSENLGDLGGEFIFINEEKQNKDGYRETTKVLNCIASLFAYWAGKEKEAQGVEFTM